MSDSPSPSRLCNCGESCWRVGGETACSSVLPPGTSPMRYLQLDDEDGRVLHHAIATVVSMMEQVGDIPTDAPLHGAGERLTRIARRLDHERRWKGTVRNPHDIESAYDQGYEAALRNAGKAGL